MQRKGILLSEAPLSSGRGRPVPSLPYPGHCDTDREKGVGKQMGILGAVAGVEGEHGLVCG